MKAIRSNEKNSKHNRINYKKRPKKKSETKTAARLSDFLPLK